MDSYQLSVVKVEGISDTSSAYCYIYLGTSILRVLTLDCGDVHPIPVNKGILKFVIEDSHSSELIASVSFESQVFKRVGFHWMPLFSDNEQCLVEVPDEVALPRILFDVQLSILSPVQEITEDSETIEDTSEEILEDSHLLRAKNIGMNVKITELEQAILLQKKKYEEDILRINTFNEQVISELKGKVIQNQEMIEGLEDLISKNSKEMLKVKAQAEEMRKRLEEGERICEEYRQRENSILIMLEKKDLEIFSLGCKLKRRPNLDIVHMGSIQTYSIRRSTPSDDSTQVASIIKEKELLALKLFEIESKVSNNSLKLLEDLHNKVKKLLAAQKLEGFATLSAELTYNFGAKKVNIYLKNGILHCQTSGVIKRLDCFLKTNCTNDIENFRKRKQKTCNTSHKRFFTSIIEFDKSSSIIHKTFDNGIRAKSNKRAVKNSETPTKRKSMSPISRNLITR